MGKISPGQDQAFFDKSMTDFVDTVCASWRLPPLAAAFCSNTASFLEKIKRNGGFDLSKAAAYE